MKIGPRGHVLWSVGGKDTGPGQFRTIGGMAVASGGKLFVADYNGRRIQTLTPNGQRWYVWSTRGLGTHQHPDSIAVQRGHVYVGFAADNTPVGGFIAVFSKHGKLLARRWSNVSPDEISVGLRGDLWVVSEVLCAGCVQGNLTRFSISGKQLQSWTFISPPLAVDDRRLSDVRVYQANADQNEIVVRKPGGKTIAVWK
jgi:outer membrane protein assembly factor BamB